MSRLIDNVGNEVWAVVFFPVGERYNSMPAIDCWVVSTIFTNLAIYKKQELNSVCHYAINLSGATINDESLINFVRTQLILHQIPPQTICFEITETLAIANLTKTVFFSRAYETTWLSFWFRCL